MKTLTFFSFSNKIIYSIEKYSNVVIVKFLSFVALNCIALKFKYFAKNFEKEKSIISEEK